jgi:hypothetical protein
MNNITVSLQVARSLRDAGWEQEDSSFYWGKFDPPKRRHLEDGTIVDIPKEEAEAMSYSWYYYNEENMPYADEDHNSWAAPTAEEVLRELPEFYTPEDNKKRAMKCYPSAHGRWAVDYEGHCTQWSDTLANAAAEMWIYLKEHDLL